MQLQNYKEIVNLNSRRSHRTKDKSDLLSQVDFGPLMSGTSDLYEFPELLGPDAFPTKSTSLNSGERLIWNVFSNNLLYSHYR